MSVRSESILWPNFLASSIDANLDPEGQVEMKSGNEQTMKFLQEAMVAAEAKPAVQKEV